MTIYLDTHCLVWLFYGEKQKFSSAALQAMEQSELLASPMSVLEMELLHEIGRTRQNASTIIAALEADIGVGVCPLPFWDVAKHALHEKWTRDPFDRLIVANARAAGSPLVSRDEHVRKHYRRTIW
jgi:PIN domain nuclease of toxin-antitoxin system